MKLGRIWGRMSAVWFAGLLALPAGLGAAAAFRQAPEAQGFVQDSGQDGKAEAQREREEERQEREQEKREREQERAERLEELYDEGREALDEERYDQARERFRQLVELNGPQTDAALYWKAYAENKLGQRQGALGTLAELKKRYAQSRWVRDAAALELEVKQSSGQPVKPEEHGDTELYNLALSGLMNSDPERAIPLIEKKLNGTASVKDKSKMLFVLAQSGEPKAMEILGNIAQGQTNPELQRKAVEYLGMFGGPEGGVEGGVQGGVKGGPGGRRSSRQILAAVYASGADESVKRAVLRSYMMSGDQQSLLNAAKTEKNESLRKEAIRQLGLTGGTGELQQLYQAETSRELRREILQAFFLAGDSKKIEEAALNEKDVELRRAAIRNLGLMGGSDVLQSIYARETDRGLKEEVLNAYFIGGNAKALVAIAKSEKDPELKKRAVEKLSIMGSKEATDYLMELLK